MAFKLLYTTERGAQGDFLVSPTLVAEAGMLGTLQGTSSGSPTGLPQVILASSGSNLIGVIDENKTTQFIATVVNEAVPTGASVNLNNANIVAGTFASGTTNSANAVLTSATNGVVSVTTAGNVSYSYVIPGKAGDDTTLASGKCTLWLQEGEYATDVYEVATPSSGAQAYTVGAPLYCSANSKLTASVAGAPASTSGLTVVGYVTKSPSAGNPFLHFYLKNDPYRVA
jgi:hypothetical protein